MYRHAAKKTDSTVQQRSAWEKVNGNIEHSQSKVNKHKILKMGFKSEKPRLKIPAALTSNEWQPLRNTEMKKKKGVFQTTWRGHANPKTNFLHKTIF